MRLLCVRCGERKGLNNFSPEPRNTRRHGRRSHCKRCCSLAARERWFRDVKKSRKRANAAYARDPIKRMASSNHTNRVRRWWVALHKSCKFNATNPLRKDVPFTITADYILQLFKKQKGRCYWLGIPLVPSMESRDPQRPSLDRIDPEKGYVPGNLVITCMFANLGRSQASRTRMRSFMKLVKAHLAAH